MKNIISFLMLSFVYGGSIAQQDTAIVFKIESLTTVKQGKPSVVLAKAEIAIDANSRGLQNEGLTGHYITLEKTNAPNFNIKATVELATNVALETSEDKVNHFQAVEITLERKSEPSGIKPSVIKTE